MAGKAPPIELIVRYDDSAVVQGVPRTEKLVADAMRRIQSPADRGAALFGAFQESGSELAAAYREVEEAAKKTQATRKSSNDKAEADEESSIRRRIQLQKSSADLMNRQAEQGFTYQLNLRKNSFALEAQQEAARSREAIQAEKAITAAKDKEFKYQLALRKSSFELEAHQAEQAQAERLRIQSAAHKQAEQAEDRQGALLLQLEKKIGLARATGESDLHNRQIERLRANGTHLLRLHKGNAEAEVKIRKWIETEYQSIEARRATFAKTPFNTMIGQNKQFLALMSRMGMSAGAAGRVIQQAGFQVGDFAVQVASGQGVMRPFIQQATQLVQGFGPWGAVLGAAGAALGGLLLYLNSAKRGVDEFTTSILNADYGRYRQELDVLRASLTQVTNAASEGMRRNDLYGFAALAAGEKVRTATKAVSENEQGLVRLYGSIDNARAAYERLQNQTVKGLRLDAEISGLEATGKEGVERDVEIQRLRNEARKQELLRGFAAERVAVQDWEQRKSKDGKKVLETQAQLSERQKDEITRINQSEKDALGLQDQIGANERLKIQRGYQEKAREEAKQEAETREKAVKAAHEREQEEARRFFEAQVSMQRSLEARLLEVQGQSALEKLMTRQAAEKAELEQRKNTNVLNEVQWEQHQKTLTAMDTAHVYERIDLARKEAVARQEKIQEANKKIASSYMSIAGVIAETWQVGPLQKALMWLQRIQTVLTAIQTIRTATAALGVLSAPVNPLGALFGAFAGARAGGGPVSLGKTYLVGEEGPELFTPAGSGTIIPHQETSRMLARLSTPPAETAHRSAVAPKKPSITHQYNLGGITIQMAPGATAQDARKLGEIAGDSILSRLRAVEGDIRDAEYVGATG